jgi:hypothetical protein
MTAGQWGQMVVVAAIVGFLVGTILNWLLEPGEPRRGLRMGTKSVLYGAHCFILHP